MLSPVKLLLERLTQLRNVVLVSLLALLLSGCVDYDLGVHFDNQHSGEITQTVKLGDRLAAINGISAQQWLDSLDQRARKLRGKTERISNSELQVTIPFTTDKDFVEKFNRFFAGQPAASELIDTPNISAQVALQQANWLLILRSHLTLDVDLSNLGISSEDEGILVNPGKLLDLDFRIDAPWGAKSKLRGPDAIAGEALPKGMVWHLLPGQLNHIESYFWMPSPLGLSSLGLLGLLFGASYLKKQRDEKQSRQAKTAKTKIEQPQPESAQPAASSAPQSSTEAIDSVPDAIATASAAETIGED